MSLDVITTLADFAIASYAVDPPVLARLLPAGFEPDVLTLRDGSKRAFVSAVPFRDVDFRFKAFPAARFAFFQTNYRAYVRYRGERCVWFFGTTLASPFVAIPRYCWKLPWHMAHTRIVAGWDGDRCREYELETRAAWGTARLSTDGELGEEPFASFADPAEASDVLTNPMRGYYHRTDRSLGTYRIWHDRLRPRLVATRYASFNVFERLNLIAAHSQPHSVLVQRRTEFSINLPPRKAPEFFSNPASSR